MLGLSEHASNLASLAECGRYPLNICAQIKCIQYWLKITQLPDDRYVKACYNDYNIFYNDWLQLLEKYG